MKGMEQNNNYTIKETFILPSKGKIYDEPINPEIELRSMTTRDEMRRTAPSEYMYKNLCEVIEDCIVGVKPKVHVYDMCIGDFIFLMHKLRIVTYGSEYDLRVKCPNCGKIVTGTTDLSNETVLEWDDKLLENLEFTLPKSGRKIKLKYTTPRMLDEIQAEKNRRLSKVAGGVMDYDIGLSLTAQALIDTVDGEKLSPTQKETFVDNMLGYDLKYLFAKSDAINEGVGLDTQVIVKCGQCGYNVVTTFRIEPEFFNPVIR